MKIGDKVRFLSETGGGKVAGFQGNNIVLVEDGDGFQIPTPLNDVVVVNDDDYSTSRVVKMKQNASSNFSNTDETISDYHSIKSLITNGMNDDDKDDNYEEDPSEKKITFRKKAEERDGGNKISVFLAFVPVDIKEVTNTKFEAYLVNDSNYYIYYTYLAAEGNTWHMRSNSEVEPNTKLFIEEFDRGLLNDIGHIAIQLIAYKKDKPFIMKSPIEVQIRIDPVKFYKLHTFQDNDFFETPSLLYTIIENDNPTRPLVIDSKKLKESMYKSSDNKTEGYSKNKNNTIFYNKRYEDGKNNGNPFVINHKDSEDHVVVDLHADEILETTSGMQPTDILNYQLKIFTDNLNKFKGKKGQKIVFIHGKGEGVLRRALINELSYRFKSYQYQDASFQEYGYGATQVTIK